VPWLIITPSGGSILNPCRIHFFRVVRGPDPRQKVAKRGEVTATERAQGLSP
jgi:hypothetical protein